MVARSGSIALKRRGALPVGIGSKSIVGGNVLEDRSGEVNRRRACVNIEVRLRAVDHCGSLCREVSFLIDLIGLRDGHALCT